MNKEELKQEGINYACEYPSIQELGYKRFGYKRIDLRKAYIAGAEPREKRIADLEAEKKEMTITIDRLESYCDAYNYSQRTYQEEIKELKAENEQIKNSDTLCKLIGEQKRKITELEQQIEKMQDKLKSDLIARLKEKMSYSTSPSCTKGMELFIKSIEKWEIKEK